MIDAARYYLDRFGDARLKPGCALIENEAEFLKRVQSDEPLHLRGKILCDWAEQVAQARGWKIETLSSPAATLMVGVPDMTETQSQALLAVLGPRFDTLPSLVNAATLLQTLAPDDLWSDPTGQEHAAKWLLWLDQRDAPDYFTPLLAAQSERWRRDCEENLQSAYAAANAETARRVLRRWLRIEAGAEGLRQAFPLPVPSTWVRQAKETWMQAAPSTSGGFYAELSRASLPPELQKAAAEVAFAYFRTNISHLDALEPSSRAELRRNLTPADNAELTRLRPPAIPAAIPAELADVLRWFKQEYLPYRHWQAEYGNEESAARVAQIASDYAAWLLETYPAALHSAGSANYECLNIARARRLRESREDTVTFWIILDGMLYSDMETLVHLLATEPRLSLSSLRPVLASLPTITRFCKPALMNGTAHTALAEDPDPVPNFEGAELLRRDSDPAIAMKNAKAGKIYVWSLVEPDASYHQRGADRPTILRNVQAELEKTANAIKMAALAVPNSLRLRVALSTDHGRMLSLGTRAHPVPQGMESHGRAAYGSSGATPTREGFLLQEGTAILFRSRFDLPCDVAVVLDGAVFRMNNDAAGSEQFAHGGLYPEETIIPWAEIARDAATPKVRVIVRGKARAGTRGILEIVLENGGAVPVTLRGLTLRPGSQPPVTLPFDLELRGQTKQEEEAEIERWFRAADAGRTTTIATFETADGRSFETEAETSLSSIEMYQRENLLEDL